MDRVDRETLSFRSPTICPIDREAARRYVVGRRTVDGGYCFYRTPEWGVEEANALDTLAALESLRLLRAAVPAPAETARWLRRLQSADGGYATLTTGWGALRALDALGLGPDLSPTDWLRSWARVAFASSNDREWRGALLGALRLLELWQLAGLELDRNQRGALARLLAVAADGRAGRWARPGADLEATAVALRLIALGDLPSDIETASEEFLRSCEDEPLGLRLTTAAATTSVGALWGGVMIARTLGLPLRHPEAIGRSIGRLQGASGGLSARDRAIATLRDTWLGLHTACLLGQAQRESGG